MGKRNRKPDPDRYYDNRLVWFFICLFIFYFGLNCVISTTFHTPLLVRWVEVGPRQWAISSEFTGLSSLRVSLFFFELFFGWFIAALLCGGAEETEGNYVGWWVFFLLGLPVIINYVSSLWQTPEPSPDVHPSPDVQVSLVHRKAPVCTIIRSSLAKFPLFSAKTSRHVHQSAAWRRFPCTSETCTERRSHGVAIQVHFVEGRI